MLNWSKKQMELLGCLEDAQKAAIIIALLSVCSEFYEVYLVSNNHPASAPLRSALSRKALSARFCPLTSNSDLNKDDICIMSGLEVDQNQFGTKCCAYCQRAFKKPKDPSK